MKFLYELVERIPSTLQNGIVYHTEEFEIACLLCACGCGHKITLLVPDSHRVIGDSGFATIRPSIGVFDSECKSHYIITEGNVEWLPAFSGVQASKIMNAQIARHVEQGELRVSWYHKFGATIRNLAIKIWSFIRGS